MRRWIPGLAAVATAAALMGWCAAGAQNSTIRMVQARAQLEKPLNARKTKQGDMVTAKLEEDVKIPNAEELPKNTVLEGHVDQVQASEHRSDSSVEVTFDKARLKGGRELPIKATVMKIFESAPMQAETAGGGMGEPGSMPGAESGGTAPGGSGPTTGGMSMPQDEAPAMNGPSAVSHAQHNGVPGVMLESDIHRASSATFTAKGRNVDVPGGTQMDVALAVIPPGVQIH